MKKRSKLKYLIFGIFIINMCYLLINQQIIINRIQSKIYDKTEQAKEIENNNSKLQDELKMAKTDEYSEKLAREKLGLIKQGEIPVLSSGK